MVRAITAAGIAATTVIVIEREGATVPWSALPLPPVANRDGLFCRRMLLCPALAWVCQEVMAKLPWLTPIEPAGKPHAKVATGATAQFSLTFATVADVA